MARGQSTYGVRIVGDESGAVRAVNTTERELRKLGREVNQASKSIRTIDKRTQSWTSGLGNLRTAIGAVGITALGTSLARYADRVFAAAEDTERMAGTLGATTTQVQELTYTFEQFRLQQDDVADALNTVVDRAQDAISGMQSYRDDFGLIGLEVENLRDKDPVGLFRAFAAAVANTENENRQITAAVRILGDDLGRKLLPLLREGADGLDRYAERGRELGKVFDEDVNKDMAEAAETFRDVKAEISGEFTTAVAENAEAFETMGAALAEIVNWGGKAVGVFTELGKGLGALAARVTGDANPVQLLREELNSLEMSQRRIVKELAEGDLPQNIQQTLREQYDIVIAEIARVNEELDKYTFTPGGGGGGDGGGPTITITDGRTRGSGPRNRQQEQALMQPLVDQMGEIMSLNQALMQPGIATQQYMLDQQFFEDAGKAANNYADALRMADGSVADLTLGMDQAGDNANEFNQEMQNAISGWASEFSAELNNAVWGAETSFDQIAESFSKMLTQMVIQKQIVEPLLDFSTSGSSTDGSRASGGPVRAGGIYQVSENGPETLRVGDRTYLMMGSQGGTVSPAQVGAGGGAGRTIVNINDYSGEQPEVTRRRGRDGTEFIDVAVARSIREGAGRRAIRETFNVTARTG